MTFSKGEANRDTSPSKIRRADRRGSAWSGRRLPPQPIPCGSFPRPLGPWLTGLAVPSGAHTCRPASASGHVLFPLPGLLCQGHCICTTQEYDRFYGSDAPYRQLLTPRLLPVNVVNVYSPFGAQHYFIEEVPTPPHRPRTPHPALI